MEIKILKNILNANEQMAVSNKELLHRHDIYTINIMATPGAGKTSFIIETIRRLKNKISIGIVEGDVASSVDSEAVSKEGVPVIQINTGGECHLEANMINNALNNLPLSDINLLFIENVGNLVCPASFDLGEDLKILISSTPEGDDKPLKYPFMFHIANVVVINKIDLLPYLKFNMDSFKQNITSINNRIDFFPISCTTGEGFDTWINWLTSRVTHKSI